jgi:glycosyltransferase involved in cell wall biosynthesis
MRTLHVIPGLAARTGGVATALVELAHGLDALGVETRILTTDLDATAGAASRRPVRPEDLVADLEGLDVQLFRARPPRRLAHSPALRRALRLEAAHADVIHTHGLWLEPTRAAGAAAASAGVPHVICPQGMLDPALGGRGRMRKATTTLVWQRRLLERAAMLHFTAAEEARLAAEVAPDVPRAVVPNAIAWSAYQGGDGAAFRERHLGGFEGPLVLNLGRIARKKGLDVLVHAFALVARELPDATLVLVGPDDEDITRELERIARAHGIRERVAFVGQLLGQEKSDALAAADVWALPTRQDAWASAVTEALAAGLPVVVSPHVNSAPELSAARAALVRELDPKAFGRAILDLLRDDDQRRRLGGRAREFARRYDRLSVARAALRMYESALAGSSVSLATTAPAHA